MNKALHILLYLVLSAVTTPAMAQTQEQDHLLDSLRAIYCNSDDDLVKIEAIDAIAYRHYSADSTVFYANKLIEFSRKINLKQYEARALDYLAWANYFYGEYTKSCEYAFEALFIADSIGDNGLKANDFFMLGTSYSRLQNMIKSNEYFYQALDIYYEIKDSSHICDVLRNIAGNNYENAMYDAAQNCLMQSTDINIKRNDKIGLSEDNYHLGRLAYKRHLDHKTSQKATDQLYIAKKYLLSSRRYAQEAQFGFSQQKAAQQLAHVMVEIAGYEYNAKAKAHILDSCQLLLNEAYDLCDKIGSFEERLNIDETYAYLLIQKKQYLSAEAFIDSLYNTLELDNDMNSSCIQRFCLARAKLYECMGHYDKACFYKDLFHEMYCNNKQADYIAQTAQNMAQANFDKKLRERDLKYETEAKIQKTINITTATVIALLILAGFFVMISYLKVKKINKLLDNKNNVLQTQKIEIEEQKKNLELQNSLITSANKEMTESINYASVIQRAVMPSKEQMESLFGDNMIIYRPLDIVSGDFYWATQVGRHKLLAVADCTGHGVPGAILSMLGISTLNDISSRIDENHFSTGEILDEMRTVIKHSLKQYGGDEDNHDGIDMALIAIDTETMVMRFSGAYRSVLLIRNGEDTSLPYDRMPVGTHYKEALHFTEHTIKLEHGDLLYIYSDGITDQFGYAENHEVIKFGINRLNTLLKNIHQQPLHTQQTMVEMAIDSWRHDDNKTSQYCQTDDALLVGIKV
ncbi:MAG: serine/threonine-protein phosphatase [Bacteroidales bacterium]|nr:serine/threonine-protein phosphatase [Bacteroidales bacterium]